MPVHLNIALSQSSAGSRALRFRPPFSPVPNGALHIPRRSPVRRAVPIPPTASQTEAQEGVQMPSADVSKRETPSKFDAPASKKEEHKPSPEQRARMLWSPP